MARRIHGIHTGLRASVLGLAFAGLVLAPLASSYRGAPATARAAATAQAAEPLRSWLYTNRATWRAAPGTRAEARMIDRANGHASASAIANADGDIVFSFTGEADRGGPPSRPGDIEPGDVLIVEVGGAEVWSVVVPDFSADAEVGPPRLFGMAPPGMAVDVALDGAGRPPFAGSVVADADGRFSLDLIDRFDLRHGDKGWVTFTDASGHAFTVLVAPLTIEMVLGTDRVLVLASNSLQTQVILHPVGAVLRSGPHRRSSDLFITGWAVFDYLLSRHPIGPSTLVTITQQGDLLDAARAHSIIVPELSLTLDASGTALSGRAPGGANLRAVIETPDGSETLFDLRADADGHVHLPLPDGSLPPGSRAELRYDDGRGHWFVAPFVVPQVRLRMYESLVEGVTAPLSPITVTVTTPSPPRTLVWPLHATRSDGLFAIRLALYDTFPACLEIPACDELIALTPGDRIEVEFAAGDPVALTVPALTARTDPEAETVSGSAPPGATVALHAGVPWPSTADQGFSTSWRAPFAPSRPATVHALADGDGTFTASLAPTIALEPTVRGYAVVELGGHWVALAWQPLVVMAALNTAYIETAGVPDRPVSATLRAGDGSIVARIQTSHERGSLRDEAGERPLIEAGDVIEVWRGDDRVVLPIPIFVGRVHVDDDRVVGQAPPGSTFTLRYRRRSEMDERESLVTADAAGLFQHDYRAEGVDLLFNQWLTADLGTGPRGWHIMRRDFDLPGLTLALHTSELRGALEPLVNLSITAARGTATLARTSTRTDGRSTFRARLSGADDRPLALVPDDQIEVTAPPPVLQQTLSLTVPPLSIAFDPDADVLGGTMPPDASLDITLGHWFLSDYRASAHGYTSPAPDPSGAWSTAFTDVRGDRADIRPGSAVGAELRLPGGHIVQQYVALPLLSGQVDGTWVCGQAAPLAEVSVTATDAAGAPLLAGNGRADDYGLFAFALSDVAGLGRTMAPSTLLHGRLGDAELSFSLPPLDLSVDWGNGAVDLHTTPGAEVMVEVTTHGCLAHGTGGDAYYDSWFARADGQGRASIVDFSPEQVAEGVVAAVYTATGMRAYRAGTRRIADIYIDTPQAMVTATARTVLSMTLAAADGRPLAHAIAEADDAGRADARMVDAEGRPVPLRAGHTLSIAAAGERAEIAIAPLSFDLSASRGLEGEATPGQDVRLRLRLTDGRLIAFIRQTDDRGRFVFTPAMVPPRSTWRWEDVRHVQAAVGLPGGHRLLSEVALAPATEAGPIYLPFGYRGF